MNKLTYEQCKELKDAGFPQEENGNSFYCNEELCGRNYDDCDQEFVIIPTLESLIEECGEEVMINNMKGYLDSREVKELWMAEKYYGIEKPQEITEGKSPIEAVLNLYLSLHKKK